MCPPISHKRLPFLCNSLAYMRGLLLPQATEQAHCISVVRQTFGGLPKLRTVMPDLSKREPLRIDPISSCFSLEKRFGCLGSIALQAANSRPAILSLSAQKRGRPRRRGSVGGSCSSFGCLFVGQHAFPSKSQGTERGEEGRGTANLLMRGEVQPICQCPLEPPIIVRGSHDVDRRGWGGGMGIACNKPNCTWRLVVRVEYNSTGSRKLEDSYGGFYWLSAALSRAAKNSIMPELGKACCESVELYNHLGLLFPLMLAYRKHFHAGLQSLL